MGKTALEDMGADLLMNLYGAIGALGYYLEGILNYTPPQNAADWDTPPLAMTFTANAWTPMRYANQVVHGDRVIDPASAKTQFRCNQPGLYWLYTANYFKYQVPQYLPDEIDLSVFKNEVQYRMLAFRSFMDYVDDQSVTRYVWSDRIELKGGTLIPLKCGDVIDLRIYPEGQNWSGFTKLVGYVNIVYLGNSPYQELNAPQKWRA